MNFPCDKMMLQWNALSKISECWPWSYTSEWIVICQYWAATLGFLLQFFMLYIEVVHTFHLKLFIIVYV